MVMFEYFLIEAMVEIIIEFCIWVLPRLLKIFTIKVEEIDFWHAQFFDDLLPVFFLVLRFFFKLFGLLLT